MKIDLSMYSLIVISTSGGKDSLCTMLETVREARRQKVGHRVICVNCDTGADWPDAKDVAKAQSSALSIPFYVVRPNISIPDYIEKRGMFPSMKCRFCTRLKTGAIDKFIRNIYPANKESKILSVTGERREESPHRQKLADFEPHPVLTAGKRQVFQYRPILEWSLEKVWQTIHESGIQPHPAYEEYGNERLSCALCVFGCEKDLRNGAKVRPDLAKRYLAIEQRTGFTFRYGQSLHDILTGNK
ncbi:MAG: phosphoadenosine phosphosulfate reductase family protein [Lentisphaeria bacterium]|nr:phosphoadenosine phosphosulfate reductase family protein [Lentisphaeria bacterium]